jgi:hypothetical protein
MAIFECAASSEKDQPEINFNHPVNKQNDWLLIGEILDGIRDTDEYPYIEIYVEDDDATDWDIYFSGGRLLFSSHFVDTVGENSFYGLVPLPAYLNGAEYWYLRCEQPLDCIDRERSKYKTFPSNPKKIMTLYEAIFKETEIPEDTCFTHPDRTNCLFMTQSVADRLLAAGIKGMKLIRDVDMSDLKY